MANDLIDQGIDRLLSHDPGMLRCPYQLYTRARESRPVFWSEAIGAYIVTRHEDVVAVARDTETFSNRDSAIPGPARRADVAAIEKITRGLAEFDDARDDYPFVDFPQVLSDADAPAHGMHRRMVLRALSAKRVRALGDVISAICDELVDAVLPAGRCELVTDLARPLPSRVILTALGIPESESPAISAMIDGIGLPVGNPHLTPEQQLERLRCHRDFSAYFRQLLADRRREPRDDLVSVIANAEAGEAQLTEPEQLSLVMQLVSAGHETTTRLIAATMLHLLGDDELRRRVLAEPDALGTVIDEVLRLESPVQGIFRLTTRPTRIGDVDIPADAVIWILWASANRDPEYVECPERLRLDRPDSKSHLAFGHGQHFCPGAQLAQLEARIAVRTLLERLPNLRLDIPADEVPFLPSIVMHGPVTMPVSF